MTYNFTAYHQGPGRRDEQVFRSASEGIPPVFHPELVVRAKENSQGTNINVTVKAQDPVALKNRDGIWTAPNKRVAAFSFTALQNVDDKGESVAFLRAVAQHVLDNAEAYAKGTTRNI